MRKALLLVYISLFLMFPKFMTAQIGQADSLVYTIVKALKAKEDKTFAILFPDYVQAKWWTKSMIGPMLDLFLSSKDNLLNISGIDSAAYVDSVLNSVVG